MEIKRDYYLKELIDRIDNGLIKIITGIVLSNIFFISSSLSKFTYI